MSKKAKVYRLVNRTTASDPAAFKEKTARKAGFVLQTISGFAAADKSEDEDVDLVRGVRFVEHGVDIPVGSGAKLSVAWNELDRHVRKLVGRSDGYASFDKNHQEKLIDLVRKLRAIASKAEARETYRIVIAAGAANSWEGDAR